MTTFLLIALYCMISGVAATVSLAHGAGVMALLLIVHLLVSYLKSHGELIEKEPEVLNSDMFQTFQKNLKQNATPQTSQKKSKPISKPISQKQSQKQQFQKTSQKQSPKPPPKTDKQSPQKIVKPKMAKKYSKTKPTSLHNNPYAKQASKPEERAGALLKELTKIQGNSDLFADMKVELPSESRVIPNEEPKNWFDEGIDESLHATSREEQIAEAQALLKFAQQTFDSLQFHESEITLKSHLMALEELTMPPSFDALMLQGKLEILHERPQMASQTFQKMLSQIENHGPKYQDVLEDIIQIFENKNYFSETLPYLYSLLNEARNSLDRVKMDLIYERIEHVLEVTGEQEKLMRTYQNHLEIRRILKDREGESRLLDALGTYHYKYGNKELSQKFYEEHMQLKAVMTQS